MRATHSKRALSSLGVAVAVLLLVPFDGPFAAETESRQSHFTDSSNGRTPAVTAFPSYPRIARRDRIEGEAVICFKITLDGRIRSIRVKSYSDRIFRRPSLRAIKDSTFEPLRPHEIFSTSRTCRTYRFRLEPVEIE